MHLDPTTVGSRILDPTYASLSMFAVFVNYNGDSSCAIKHLLETTMGRQQIGPKFVVFLETT
jgi:hypothetical protein